MARNNGQKHGSGELQALSSSSITQTSLLTHLKHYGSASAVSAVVGLITFPLLTRNLDVGSYGLLGLITMSVTMLVAFGKLGLQHSVLRFYPKAEQNIEEMDLARLHATAFVLIAALMIGSVFVWLVGGWLVVPHWLQNSSIPRYFSILAVFIVLRMLASITGNMLRAKEHSRTLGNSVIAARLIYLMLLLIAGVTFGLSVTAVLVITVLAEIVSLLICVIAYRPYMQFDRTKFSLQLSTTLLAYGLPLMLMEAVYVLVRLMDRYMIGSMLGEFELGQYAASASLVLYAEMLVVGTVATAIKPRYNRLWESSGRVETTRFLNRGASFYISAGIPIVGLFVLIAPDALVFLAGERYLAGARVIPYFALAVFVDGLMVFLLAGIHLQGKTRLFLYWGVIAALMNFCGNYLLIPVLGISGAAMVSLFAYLFFVGGLWWSASRWLAVALPWRRILYLTVLTLCVVISLWLIPLQRGFHSGLLRVVLAVPLLAIISLVIDRELWKWLTGRSLWKRGS